MLSMKEFKDLIESSGALILNGDSYGNLKEDSTELCRTLNCTTITGDIDFEWWSNIAYANVSGVKIVFDEITVSGTWPNSYKTNINLKRNGSVCAVIPTEVY